MQNGNAQTATVFSDAHRFGKHMDEMITVHLVKCESHVGEFFLLTKTHIDWNAVDDAQITDQVFRKPMEAMRAAINMWNAVVMENPVTDEAPEPEDEYEPASDGLMDENDFPF